jgi:Ca2+-binding RTX toxin-like protein
VDLFHAAAGADTFSGGDGADRFYAIRAGDTVSAGGDNDIVVVWGAPALIDGGEGTDIVRVGADTTFAAGSLVSVERVQVANGAAADLSQVSNGGAGQIIQSLSTAGGSTAVTGTASADRFVGAAGADSFSGGDGRDTYTGASGSDTFVFDAALGSNNIDRLTDFNPADDTMVVNKAAFGADFRLGSLGGQDDFFAGSSPVALGSDDALLYDTDDGRLFFDVNGQAQGGATKVAVLQGAPQLGADDILIV